MALVAGFVGLRKQPGDASTAIRASSAAGTTLGAADGWLPQTPAPPTTAGAISLPELVAQIRARTTTSSTRPPATTTTVKRAATSTTAQPRSTTTRPAPAPAPAPADGPPTTAPVAPLAPVTTLLSTLVPPAVAVSGALTHTDSGVASWFKAPVGTCAHRTLPMGTLIKVTRSETGASTSCKVDDRGPTVETGRLIDLSLDTFEKLAPRDAGLLQVRIEW